MRELRPVLEALYAAALDAAQPGPAVTAVLPALEIGPRVHIIAIGKAADGMASATEDWLQRTGRALAGGVVVAPSAPRAVPPDGRVLLRVAGDHPRPGDASARAAERIGTAARAVSPDDTVLVLLSGGASSLAGAPVSGIAPAELAALNDLLLGSGLDIAGINAVRKRFSRWGAGRLARALQPARVHCLLLSDVPGDDPALIGSGPCTGDAHTAADVIALLESARIWDRAPDACRAHLRAVSLGRAEETPKPGDAALARVESRIVGNNATALGGAAGRAAALGLPTELVERPLSGEASLAGRDIARRLAASERGRCLIWGGETVVTLGTEHGTGGRCQELALAAAASLAGSTTAALLAAGTDGRDGPTDAAGAVIDGDTWARIARAGRVPADDLATHDALPALAAAGALLPARATGTNVADIVIAVA